MLFGGEVVEGAWEAWLGSGQGIAAGLLITERENDIQACGDLSDTYLLDRMEKDLKLSPSLSHPLPLQCTCTEFHDTLQPCKIHHLKYLCHLPSPWFLPSLQVPQVPTNGCIMEEITWKIYPYQNKGFCSLGLLSDNPTTFAVCYASSDISEEKHIKIDTDENKRRTHMCWLLQHQLVGIVTKNFKKLCQKWHVSLYTGFCKAWVLRFLGHWLGTMGKRDQVIFGVSVLFS